MTHFWILTLQWALPGRTVTLTLDGTVESTTSAQQRYADIRKGAIEAASGRSPELPIDPYPVTLYYHCEPNGGPT